jgi:hypothetical protein
MDFELQRLKGQVPESVKFLEDLGFVWDGSASQFTKSNQVFRLRISRGDATQPVAVLKQNRYVRIALHLMNSQRKN